MNEFNESAQLCMEQLVNGGSYLVSGFLVINIQAFLAWTYTFVLLQTASL